MLHVKYPQTKAESFGPTSVVQRQFFDLRMLHWMKELALLA